MPDHDATAGSGQEIPASGRILALDLGGARIGVAVSDPGQRMAVPVGTIHAGQPPHDVRAVAALVEEHHAAGIVVGYPLGLSGALGEAAHHAEGFAGTLRDFLGLPVVLQDERLTTVQAERDLAAAGVRGRARRSVVDQAAAALILQAFLDARRGPSPPPG